MSTARQTRRGHWGFALVVVGLVLQVGAAFFWTPGTFVLSAAVAVPLVLLGVLLLGSSAIGVSRSQRNQPSPPTVERSR